MNSSHVGDLYPRRRWTNRHLAAPEASMTRRLGWTNSALVLRAEVAVQESETNHPMAPLWVVHQGDYAWARGVRHDDMTHGRVACNVPTATKRKRIYDAA